MIIKATLALLLAILAAVAFRRAAAATRHTILVAGQLAALIVPLLTLVVPHVTVETDFGVRRPQPALSYTSHAKAEAAASALQIIGQWLALALLERGLIVQPASQAWNVLRLEPPLTVTREELIHATHVIGEVFDANRSVAPILARTGLRAAAQFLNRGRFR